MNSQSVMYKASKVLRFFVQKVQSLIVFCLVFCALLILFQRPVAAQAVIPSDIDIATRPEADGKQYTYLPLIVSNGQVTSAQTDGGTIYSGLVTDAGVPLATSRVNLDYFDGQSWATFTTTTDLQGQYSFPNLPELVNGELFYIYWINHDDDTQKLGAWACWPVTINTQAFDDYHCDFDVSGVALNAPTPGATTSLPAQFSWRPRNISTDIYEFNLIDPADLSVWWWTDPVLGYTDAYTLSTLPPNFTTNHPYGWFVWLYSQEGYGLSYYYYQVIFSSPLVASAAAQSIAIQQLPTNQLLTVGNATSPVVTAAGIDHALQAKAAPAASAPLWEATKPSSSTVQSLPAFLAGTAATATNEIQAAATDANVLAVLHGSQLDPNWIQQLIIRPERSPASSVQRLQQMLNGSAWVFFDDHSFAFVPVGIGTIVRSDLFPAWGTWQPLSDGSIRISAATVSNVGTTAANRYDMSAIIMQTQDGAIWVHVGEETNVVMAANVNNTSFGSNSYRYVEYWLPMN